MFPAYVCGNVEEREVVKEVVGKSETLDEAFKTLKERIDPPIDEYTSTQRFSELKWSPGNIIGDYYYSLLREAKRAKLWVKMVCILLTVKLLKAVQSILKAYLAEKEERSEADGGTFIV